MGYERTLVGLVISLSVISEIKLPLVKCQADEDEPQCLPRKTFFALLRIPEVSSNLAAYSRTARVSQEAGRARDSLLLRALNADERDAEICLPSALYLELFSEQILRGQLSAIDQAQRLLESNRRSGDVSPEKRSLATLAKNDDLPISMQGRDSDGSTNDEDEEKRSLPDGYESAYEASDYEDQPSYYSDDYMSSGKRNVAALARDFALPSGKRNVASLARGATFPYVGKRIPFPMLWAYHPQRDFFVRQSWQPYEKRNVASIARDYGLPSGKRYAGKRNIGSLARDRSLPPQTRHGRSGYEEPNLDEEYPMEASRSDEFLSQKRFLGRIPQMGPRPTTPPSRLRY